MDDLEPVATCSKSSPQCRCDLVAQLAQRHEVVCFYILAGRVVVERPVMGVRGLRRPAQLAGSGRTAERLRSRRFEVPAVWVLCHASSCFCLVVVELPLPCRARPCRAPPCRVLFERASNRRRVALRCAFRCRGIYCGCCALKAPILVSVAALAVSAAGALLLTTASSYHSRRKAANSEHRFATHAIWTEIEAHKVMAAARSVRPAELFAF